MTKTYDDIEAVTRLLEEVRQVIFYTYIYIVYLEELTSNATGVQFS